MSRRWQILLSTVVVCAVLLSGASTKVALAQCCHGGGRIDPGVLQVLLQQVLLQQQQLLQTIQQQQLQTAILERQVRELAGQGPEAIKAALKDPLAEKRWVAALVIGEYAPSLANELIELLTDDNPYVRQSARRGLIRLSTTFGKREGKPSTGRRVDFGPAPNARRSAQQTAAGKWRSWFERQQARPINLKTVGPAAPAARPAVAKEAPIKTASAEEEAERLRNELLQGPPRRREAALTNLRDGKGVAYTLALARAIPQLEGDDRTRARESLAERMTRMSAATLRDKLKDTSPEVRRAAALACAMKKSRNEIPDLIALLQDADPAVPPAARAALKSLTNQDFGAVSGRDRAEQTRVASAWKAWWQGQIGR
jgi:HEAT repeat protein